MSHKRINEDAAFIFNLMLLLFFLDAITLTVSTVKDVSCLKSIKDSLEDPHGYLSSWNFNNSTDGFICRFNGVECWHGDENKVLNLKLSNMGLKGQFPLGIENCTSLTGLDLSSNDLYGSIPIDIAQRLTFITSLDLSFNDFSGEIPASIANCTYLTVLRLNNNDLTGRIPEEIGKVKRLKEFSVANNKLSGQVPEFVNAGYISEEAYANNTGLCGGPLEKCGPQKSFANGFQVGYAVSVVTVVVGYVSYFVPWLNVKVGNRNKYITVASLILLKIRRNNNGSPPV